MHKLDTPIIFTAVFTLLLALRYDYESKSQKCRRSQTPAQCLPKLDGYETTTLGPIVTDQTLKAKFGKSPSSKVC